MPNLLDTRLIIGFVLLLLAIGGIFLLLQLFSAWRGKKEIIEATAAPEELEATLPAKPPIRILFLAANPSDTDPLRLGAEVRAIDRSLRGAEFRDRFELEQQWAVRMEELQDHLLRYQPDIVHFSGHGSTASEIILEDEDGESHPVPRETLGELFSLLKDNIRCVLLNACYSEGQAHAIAQSIDCVIGMSDAISDEAAIDFSSAFYRALGYGRNVQMAYALAVNQIAMAGIEEADVPVLLDLRQNAETTEFA